MQRNSSGTSAETGSSVDHRQTLVIELHINTSPRSLDMLLRRMDGESLEAIAQRWGVSRERVRQLSAKVTRQITRAVGAKVKSTGARRTSKITGTAALVHAHGEARDPKGLPVLIAALSDASSNVRRLAASALGKLGDPAAVGPLVALLAVEVAPQCRQYAVKALGVLGDPRAVSILERIASSAREAAYTRDAAKHALQRIAKRNAVDWPDKIEVQL